MTDPASHPASVVDGRARALEAPLIPDALTRRLARPPDPASEHAILLALARAVAGSPTTAVPHHLAEAARELTGTGSAGALLAGDPSSHAVSGRLHPLPPHSVAGVAPWDAAMTGNAPVWIDEVTALPFWLSSRSHPVQEILAVPIAIGDGRAVGALWAAAHDGDRRLDAEDARRLGRLAEVAAAMASLAGSREAAPSPDDTVDVATRTSKVGIWAWDLDRDELVRTASLDRILGLPVETGPIPVARFTALIHPEDRERVEQALHAATREAGSGELEYRVVRPDGRVVWLYTSGALYAEPGQPRRLVGVTVDVTKRKRAEKELRTSERRFRELLDGLPAAAYTCDAQGLITYFNRQAVELWGREPRLNDPADRYCGSFRLFEVDGTPVRHEDCWMARAVTERARFDGEVMIERPDGTRRTALAHASPLLDHHGMPAGAVNVVVDITERRALEEAERHQAIRDREAAEALRRSEQRFARFMRHLPGLAWIKDGGGRYVFVNDAAERAFGRPRAEIYGRTDAELFTPDTAARFQANDQAALESDRGVETIEVLEHGDGPHYSLVTKFAIPSANGSPSLVGGMAIDITERMRIEHALRHSEERFRTLAMNAPAAVFIKDLEGRYTLANAITCEALGRPDGCLGLMDQDLTSPDDAERSRASDREVIETGRPVEYDQAVGPPGSVRYFRTVKFPLLGPDGRPAGVCGVAVDITDRTRVEQALREGEQRFRMLADHAPVLIWLNHREGCEFVNREYLRFTGRPLEQLTGMQWADLLHPDDRDAYLDGYRAAMAAAEPFEAQARMRRFDGEYRWIRSGGTPRFDPTGTLTGYVGCSVDLTEIKRSEQALRDADQRKDEFLATLAHELRNPLAPIRSSLHVLRLAGDGPAAERVHDVIERQVDHMVRLVDDLLEISRITHGKIELRRERVDLAAILTSALETSRPVIDAARHQLFVALPNEPVPLDADPMRLAQVVGNLLNNASRYTDEGGRIWLTAERRDDAAIISVRDNGAGIPADKLPFVFEPFVQIDRAGGRARGGLGIGLTLVKRLVELHGGTVEARSEGAGLGSTFTVTLPLAATEAAAPRQTGGNGSRASDAGPARRVLVVDDNADAADSLGDLLRLTGFDVRVAHDGRSALDALCAFHPDAVLLDLGMPDMDGFEVAEWIRQQPDHADTVLIAVTGWGQPEDRARSLESGFDHHLVKPVELDTLRGLLAEPHPRAPVRGGGWRWSGRRARRSSPRP